MVAKGFIGASATACCRSSRQRELSQVLQDGTLLAVGDKIMEADDPRGDFIAEAIRRSWLTRNGGFVLHRPGLGFELVCTTIDGSARIQKKLSSPRKVSILNSFGTFSRAN